MGAVPGDGGGGEAATGRLGGPPRESGGRRGGGALLCTWESRSCVQTAICTASSLYPWQLGGAGRAGQGPQSQTWAEAGTKSPDGQAPGCPQLPECTGGTSRPECPPVHPRYQTSASARPSQPQVRQAWRAGARETRCSKLAGAGFVSKGETRTGTCRVNVCHGDQSSP